MSANSTLYGPTYGSPLYFAAILATAFYGVTCMQTFFYYVHYQNDRLHMKSFVAVLWALNTIHEALIIAGVYKYLMAGLLNPESMLFAPPEIVLQLLLTALVAVPTQGFFVHRLYIFSKKYIIFPCIWLLLAIVQIVLSILYVSEALYSANGVHVVPTLSDSYFTDISTGSLSVGAGVDVLIAIGLTLLLLRKRLATPIANTANILQRLTVFAVNTGIWSAMFALLSVVFLQVNRLSLLYAVFGFPLCSIYCNTLLANLNARAYVRGETAIHHIELDLFDTSSSQSSDIGKTDEER